jgi:hypothetical protein
LEGKYWSVKEEARDVLELVEGEDFGEGVGEFGEY